MTIFQFVVTNIFMLSVGTVLYMAVRTLPRIEEEPALEKKGVFERWITSEVPEKIDAALNGFLFKFIKKARVFLLRFDNTLGEQLKKIKPDANGNGKPKIGIDFKAMTEDKGKEDQVASGSDLSNNQ